MIDHTEAARKPSVYSGLARRVQDPVWRGFIVINPLSRPDTVLPPDLAWLAAMINPSLSFVHHLGGDWQNVWTEGRTLTPLFATIDYSTIPPSSVTSEKGVYLRVRFESGALIAVETSSRPAAYSQSMVDGSFVPATDVARTV